MLIAGIDLSTYGYPMKEMGYSMIVLGIILIVVVLRRIGLWPGLNRTEKVTKNSLSIEYLEELNNEFEEFDDDDLWEEIYSLKFKSGLLLATGIITCVLIIGIYLIIKSNVLNKEINEIKELINYRLIREEKNSQIKNWSKY